MRTDVLIIGAGLTGVVAADEIIQNSNLEVIQLSDGSGASPYIHGFCMPVGEADSESLFYEDTIRSGYYQSDSKLVRQLCMNSMALQDYFEDLGLELDQDEEGVHLLRALGSTVPRIAGIHNSTGPAMLKRLRERLKQAKNYKELSGQRALELICVNDRVVGAKCYDAEKDCFYPIYAKAVILATGGFGRIFPESTNSQDIGGDGPAMAYLAGAALTDMEFIQFEPSAAVWPPQVAGKGIVTTMFYDGAVLRGKDGSRFMLKYSEDGERVPKDVQSKYIYDEIRKSGGTPHGGVWFDATKVPEEKWQGAYKPYLKRYLACGIDLRQESVEIAPAAHTTCGGVKMDENCRTGILGLIVCGEAAGGLHGANRLGGNAGLETMVFGRIAGKSAIEEAAKDETALGKAANEQTVFRQTEYIPNIPADMDVSALRVQLQDIIRGSLNVIRNKDGLEQGIREVSQMLQNLGEHRNCYEKHRMYNDLLTAYITMVSALERSSSVGCHCREDAIEEIEKYRIEVKKCNGHMRVLRKPI